MRYRKSVNWRHMHNIGKKYNQVIGKLYLMLVQLFEIKQNFQEIHILQYCMKYVKIWDIINKHKNYWYQLVNDLKYQIISKISNHC